MTPEEKEIKRKAVVVVQKLEENGFLDNVFKKMSVSWDSQRTVLDSSLLSSADIEKINKLPVEPLRNLLNSLGKLGLDQPRSKYEAQKKIYTVEVTKFMDFKNTMTEDEIFELGKRLQQGGIENATLRRLSYLLRGYFSKISFLKSLIRGIRIHDITLANPKLKIVDSFEGKVSFDFFHEIAGIEDIEKVTRKIVSSAVPEVSKFSNHPDGTGQEFFGTAGFLYSSLVADLNILRHYNSGPVIVENSDYPGVPATIHGFGLAKDGSLDTVEIAFKNDFGFRGSNGEELLKARHALIVTGAQVCNIVYVRPNGEFFKVKETFKSHEDNIPKAKMLAEKFSKISRDINFSKIQKAPIKRNRLCYSLDANAAIRALNPEIETLSSLTGQDFELLKNKVQRILKVLGPNGLDRGMEHLYGASLNPKGFVGVDIETTNQGPMNSEIIDLGVIVVDNCGNVIEELDIPLGLSEVSKDVLNAMYPIHGIHNSQLEGLTTFVDDSSLQAKLLELFTSRPMVAHNASFEDTHFALNIRGYLSAKRDKKIQIVDTMKISQWIGDQSEGNSLENYARIYNSLAMDKSELHRGYDDTRIMLEAMFNHLKEIK